MSYPQTYHRVRSEDGLDSGRKTQENHKAPLGDPQELLLEARAYLHLFHQEQGRFETYPERFTGARAEIVRTGTYRHTYDELAYGAKVAWRNNTRCIGRLHWKSLAVRDMRHLETAEEIFAALVEHLRLGTNGGKIHSLMTIFAPAVPGISYTAAPFNGWYMGTEIGARNLGDVDRYNLLPVIAEHMGLNTRFDRTLWRDRALVELNVAVLSSFAKHRVTIVDHHTASRQFLLHDETEKQAGRTVPAHWVWIVPPISGSASPIFHIPSYKNTMLKPNFFYQPAPWKEK